MQVNISEMEFNVFLWIAYCSGVIIGYFIRSFMMVRYLSIDESARVLGVTNGDIRDLAKLGILKPISKIHSIRFLRIDIIDYYRDNFDVSLEIKKEKKEIIKMMAKKGETLDAMMYITKISKSKIREYLEHMATGTGNSPNSLKDAAGLGTPAA